MMIFANIFGSMANEILPQGAIMIFLMVIIFVGILINIRNAIKQFRRESMELANEDFDPDRPKAAEIELQETLISKKPKPDEVSKFPSNHEDAEEVSKLKYYEGRNFHPIKTPIFLATILVTVVYFLLKGSSSLPSIAGLPKCHWGQNLILGVTIVGILILQIISIRIVLKEQDLKLKYNLHEEHEVLFSTQKIVFLVAFAIIVGFLANLLGLGGGFVIFPMFVSIGVSPLVASATTIFMIFLSKTVAALLAGFSPFLKMDYTGMMVACVAVSVVVFSAVADAILKR